MNNEPVQVDRARAIEPYRLDGAVLSLGCLPCPLLDICGGERRVGGSLCPTRCLRCDRSKCNLVCLGKPEAFVQALREIGGFAAHDIGPLRSPAGDLPTYVPMVQHSSGRSKPLNTPWAAVPLSAVVRRPGGRPTPAALTPEALRELFQVGRDTKLLLIGVDHDRHIEHYWRWRNVARLPEALAGLDLAAAVVPNYSFDLQHPRTHHMHSRKRSLICAREWSRVGIPTIPYLQAVNADDYGYWFEFLKAHPEISVVAKEFQTGGAVRARGLWTLSELARLQERLKRPLHLVAVGGTQYRMECSEYFDRWTLVDSMPFMRAVRGRLRARIGSRRVYWERGAAADTADELLAHGIEVWRQWIAMPLEPCDHHRQPPSRRQPRSQLFLPLTA